MKKLPLAVFLMLGFISFSATSQPPDKTGFQGRQCSEYLQSVRPQKTTWERFKSQWQKIRARRELKKVLSIYPEWHKDPHLHPLSRKSFHRMGYQIWKAQVDTYLEHAQQYEASSLMSRYLEILGLVAQLTSQIHLAQYHELGESSLARTEKRLSLELRKEVDWSLLEANYLIDSFNDLASRWPSQFVEKYSEYWGALHGASEVKKANIFRVNRKKEYAHQMAQAFFDYEGFKIREWIDNYEAGEFRERPYLSDSEVDFVLFVQSHLANVLILENYAERVVLTQELTREEKSQGFHKIMKEIPAYYIEIYSYLYVIDTQK